MIIVRSQWGRYNLPRTVSNGYHFPYETRLERKDPSKSRSFGDIQPWLCLPRTQWVLIIFPLKLLFWYILDAQFSHLQRHPTHIKLIIYVKIIQTRAAIIKFPSLSSCFGISGIFPRISHRIAKVTWCSSQWEPQRCGSLGAPSPPRRCHWPPPCAGRRWPRPLLPRRRGRTSLNPGDASPILGECHGQMIIEWFVQSWSR